MQDFLEKSSSRFPSSFRERSFRGSLLSILGPVNYVEAKTNLFVEVPIQLIQVSFILNLPRNLGHCTWIPGGIENFNFPLHLLFDAFGPNSGIRASCTILNWVKYFLEVELYEMHV